MKLRYERKYLVPNHKLNDLRLALRPFMRPDIHAGLKEGYPNYTVRSIYFDNTHRNAVIDKLEGLRDRKKLRIRGYDKLKEDSLVFTEIKKKISDRIFKNRAPFLYRNIKRVLQTGEYEPFLLKNTEKNRNDASRFLYNLKRFHMEPVNLIVYRREPYHGIFNSDTRITFDKDIRSRIYPQITELYDDVDFVYPWAGHFIMEIKYYESPMPSWAKSVVWEFDLKAEALSKYVEGFRCHPLAY
nr:polyphosphate polymerase domain-containing protein [Saprospiraceae bacterium]